MTRYMHKGRVLRVFKLHERGWYIGYLQRGTTFDSGRVSMEGMPTFCTQEAAQEYLDGWALQKGVKAA